MTRRTFLLPLAAMTIVFAGCERSIDLELPTDGELQLTIRDEAASTYCIIKASSDGAMKVATWLDANQDGWESSLVSFAPGVQLNGEGFSINFHRESAIVNYEAGQFTHAVPAVVYTGLSCQKKS